MYMQRLIGKVLDEEELLEQIEKEEELAVMKKDGGGFDHRSVNYNNSSQSFGGIVGKKNAKRYAFAMPQLFLFFLWVHSKSLGVWRILDCAML